MNTTKITITEKAMNAIATEAFKCDFTILEVCQGTCKHENFHPHYVLVEKINMKTTANNEEELLKEIDEFHTSFLIIATPEVKKMVTLDRCDDYFVFKFDDKNILRNENIKEILE